MCKRLRSYLLPALLLLSICLSCWVSAPCYAGEPTSTDATPPQEMTLTPEEYSRLESSLNELAILNRESRQGLTELRSQLAASQAALSEARQQSITLTQQLAALRASSTEQESLLQTANQSLQALEQEQKEQQRTQARLKWQRNIAWGLLGCVLVAGLA